MMVIFNSQNRCKHKHNLSLSVNHHDIVNIIISLRAISFIFDIMFGYFFYIFICYRLEKFNFRILFSEKRKEYYHCEILTLISSMLVSIYQSLINHFFSLLLLLFQLLLIYLFLFFILFFFFFTQNDLCLIPCFSFVCVCKCVIDKNERFILLLLLWNRYLEPFNFIYCHPI